MNWYVLYTKPRCEKKTEQQLLSMGIDAYCPTTYEFRFWSDRKKKVIIPLLPSIVLVKINNKDFNKVFESPNVIRYMFWLGKRAVVRQSEVDVLKKYLNEGYSFLNCKISNINIGDNLNLSSFKNENGIVTRISNNNVWVYLKSIGYNVKLKLA